MANVYGIELPNLPDNLRALEVVTILRCVDLSDEGSSGPTLCLRVSGGIPTWELLGMLTGLAHDASRDFLTALQPTPDDPA